MSAPGRFAAGTICLRKNGVAFFSKNGASEPNPRPGCLLIPLQNESSICSERAIWKRF